MVLNMLLLNSRTLELENLLNYEMEVFQASEGSLRPLGSRR